MIEFQKNNDRIVVNVQVAGVLMDGEVLHAFAIYNDYMSWSMTTKLSRQRSQLVAEEERLSHLMLAHRDLDKMLQNRVNDVLTCAKQLLSLVALHRPPSTAEHMCIL